MTYAIYYRTSSKSSLAKVGRLDAANIETARTMATTAIKQHYGDSGRLIHIVESSQSRFPVMGLNGDLVAPTPDRKPAPSVPRMLASKAMVYGNTD
jgi:hypothetical protein